ncbi:M42 family metallopeptidase [Hutsoniella sourekii]|uniref:M42 family metallopeptidase n=1 Tax=Hutsoniella sourekii TaxID=87650 RepID=UPI0004AE4AE0|nr:M20/M25/M40 family metallo-hydrolase [Hutsoniella sourekii]
MSIDLIKDLSNAFGPSGFESEVKEIAKNYVQSFASYKEDKMGNLLINMGSDQENKGPRILLDAHMDEVGFIVQNIRPNGMLEFLPLGGWTPYTIPAHLVHIKTRSGELIKGVVASKPPHYMSEAERNQNVTIQSLVIDVGSKSSQETQDLGIEIGNPVVPCVEFESLHQDQILLGKAFDCRIGVAALLETLQDIAPIKDSLDCQIQAALTTQEEVGLRGAKVIANQVACDLAIVFEGAPADDSFAPDYQIQSGLGKGPMLRHFDTTMITHPGFQALALDTAKELKIPVQVAVRSGGGTNGAAYHLAQQGIPTIVVAVPVRYPHTHYGYVAYEDYQACKELVTAILKKMNSATYQAL